MIYESIMYFTLYCGLGLWPFYRLPAAGQQEVRFLLLLLLLFLFKTKLQICRISCCQQAKQVEDEAEVLYNFYRLPAAGQQVIRILVVLLVLVKTKLQIYRISCCKQSKQVGDEAEGL